MGHLAESLWQERLLRPRLRVCLPAMLPKIRHNQDGDHNLVVQLSRLMQGIHSQQAELIALARHVRDDTLARQGDCFQACFGSGRAAIAATAAVSRKKAVQSIVVWPVTLVAEYTSTTLLICIPVAEVRPVISFAAQLKDCGSVALFGEVRAASM